MSPTEVIEQAKLNRLTFEADCEGSCVGVEIYVPGLSSYIAVNVGDGFAFPPDTSYGPLGMKANYAKCLAMSCAFRVAAYLLDGTLTLNDKNELIRKEQP